jgi:hypothetical protein
MKLKANSNLIQQDDLILEEANPPSRFSEAIPQNQKRKIDI